jgi:hypothetical protein
MVVRRKPKSVNEFIQEGGSPAQEITSQAAEQEVTEAEVKGLKLRLPVDLLERVDISVKSRRPVPSRHQWILEAIYEKLDREAEANAS